MIDLWQGKTPLHMAAWDGDEGMVRSLLQPGAEGDPNEENEV